MATVRLRAFAKVNLSLEVLNKRPDGFHNLRTVFQTITLADVIEIEASRARTTTVSVQADVGIPGENLMVRAAHAVLEATGVSGRVSMRLTKRIPIGGGLGGGSADAAAVVRALPGLLRKALDPEKEIRIAAGLGSDVPVFLIGGTVLGMGRGTELYPLPDLPVAPLLVVSPGIHVSTPDAYRRLARTEAMPEGENRTAMLAQALAQSGDWTRHCTNDFEPAVFALHPQLEALRRRLARHGARPAMMTGSGSAIFGVFGDKITRDTAAKGLQGFRVSFLPRQKYRRIWPDVLG